MSLTLTIPAPCDWLNANPAPALGREGATHPRMAVHGPRRCPRAGQGRPLRRASAHHGDYPQDARGRYDVANYGVTAKAIVDGLVDSGLLEDDDNTRVIGPDMRAGEKRDAACVVVTVRAINQTAKDAR